MSVTFLEQSYTFAPTVKYLRDLRVEGAIYAKGGTTLTQGNTHTIQGNIVVVSGAYNTVDADFATAMGDHLQVRNDSMTAVGSYNFEDDALFVVGNGTDEANRSDALVVTSDGSVYLDSIVFQNSGTLISATGDAIQLDGDVLASGNVGIHMTNPEYALDVNGTARANVYTGFGNVEISTPDSVLFTVHGDEKIRITSSGTLGIGTSAPAETVHVIGNIVASGDILSSFSDARLKSNVRVIPDPVEKLKQLKGVFYTYNDVARQHGFTSADEHVGVIAQDVEMVLPHAVRLAPFDMEGRVSKSGSNYLTVQYEKIVPLLVEAIKEQSQVIESQAEHMAYMSAEIDAIKRQLN